MYFVDVLWHVESDLLYTTSRRETDGVTRRPLWDGDSTEETHGAHYRYPVCCSGEQDNRHHRFSHRTTAKYETENKRVQLGTTPHL